MKIPISKISVPEVRASAKYTPEQEEFFKSTVEKLGIVNPITVRKVGVDSYELVAGLHRLNELKEKGIKEVDAVVIDADTKTAYMMHIAENVARGTVDPISVAQVIKKLQNEGSTTAEIAKVLGKSENWVRFMTTLLDLPEVYQEALKEGKLKVAHVREAARLPNPTEIDAALSSALLHEWKASTLKNFVDNRLEQIKTAVQTGDLETIQTPPPDKIREQLAAYKQCLICGRSVKATEIRLPTQCEGCYNLARYITNMLGDPENAMQTVYEALKMYMTMKQAEEYKKKMQGFEPGGKKFEY